MMLAGLFSFLLFVTSAALAAERVAPPQSKLPAVAVPTKTPPPSASEKEVRPPMEQARTPRIESLGPRDALRQFYVLDGLQINFVGLGAPGQVRLTVQPFTQKQAEALPTIPGAQRLTDCYFAGTTGNSVPAVVNADGSATGSLNGFWLPKQRDQVGSNGYCRIEVRIDRLQANLSYREEARMVSSVITIARHETVVIRNTAQLRPFLKPVASANCKPDDDPTKFAIRITAGLAAHNCRTDFLNPYDANRQPTGNPLTEGAILAAVSWNLQGDTGRCELCGNPLSPCRGVTPQAIVAESVGFEMVRWIYAPVQPGNNAGYLYAAFTGPPVLMRGAHVRVNTHDYDYNTAMPDYLKNLYQAATGVTVQEYEAAVIGTGTGNWRSFMRPFGIGMACSMWSPPSAADARQAIGSAVGQVSQGQKPTPLAAPYLRLLLDSITVWRPAGRKLPWE